MTTLSVAVDHARRICDADTALRMSPPGAAGRCGVARHRRHVRIGDAVARDDQVAIPGLGDRRHPVRILWLQEGQQRLPSSATHSWIVLLPL